MFANFAIPKCSRCGGTGFRGDREEGCGSTRCSVLPLSSGARSRLVWTGAQQPANQRPRLGTEWGFGVAHLTVGTAHSSTAGFRTRTRSRTRIGLLFYMLTTFLLNSVNAPHFKPRGRSQAVLPSGTPRSPRFPFDFKNNY